MRNPYTYVSVRSGTSSTFQAKLSEYDSVVPGKVGALEAQRTDTIPAALTRRKESEGKTYLTKQEVVTLVEWKLSHGTFRPSLKSLVQQNYEDAVREITTAGFEADTLKDALAILTKLKGIGPATASLLLSTNDPGRLPFFSDELFRWVFWEDKPGCRWDRKIKYSAKEYRELAEKVDEVLKQRAGEVTAIELEKFAYVLGRKGVDLAAANPVGGAVGGSGSEVGTRCEEKRKRKISGNGVVVKEDESNEIPEKRRGVVGKPVRSVEASTDAGPRRSTRSAAREKSS